MLTGCCVAMKGCVRVSVSVGVGGEKPGPGRLTQAGKNRTLAPREVHPRNAYWTVSPVELSSRTKIIYIY